MKLPFPPAQGQVSKIRSRSVAYADLTFFFKLSLGVTSGGVLGTLLTVLWEPSGAPQPLVLSPLA